MGGGDRNKAFSPSLIQAVGGTCLGPFAMHGPQGACLHASRVERTLAAQIGRKSGSRKSARPPPQLSHARPPGTAAPGPPASARPPASLTGSAGSRSAPLPPVPGSESNCAGSEPSSSQTRPQLLPERRPPNEGASPIHVITMTRPGAAAAIRRAPRGAGRGGEPVSSRSGLRPSE